MFFSDLLEPETIPRAADPRRAALGLEIRKVGNSVEDRNLLAPLGQFSLEDSHRRLVAVVDENPLQGSTEASRVASLLDQRLCEGAFQL